MEMRLKLLDVGLVAIHRHFREVEDVVAEPRVDLELVGELRERLASRGLADAHLELGRSLR